MPEVPTNRPNDFARWASSPTASVTEPPEAKKDIGWVAPEPPPASFMNWLFERVYDSFSYFDARSLRVWDDLHDFTANSPPPPNSPVFLRGIVDEYDPSVAPLTRLWGYIDAAAPQTTSVSADGRAFFVASDQGVTVLKRDGTSAGVPDLGAAGNPYVFSTGRYVYVADGNELAQYDHPLDTINSWPSSNWTFDHGGVLNGLYADDDNILIFGASGLGSNTHRMIGNSGNEVWVGDHGAEVKAGLLDGFNAWIAGERDAGTPATLRRLSYEGDGAGSEVVYASHDHGHPIYALAQSRTRIYTGGDANADLEAFDKFNLSAPLWTNTTSMGGSNINALYYDAGGDILWVGGVNGAGVKDLIAVVPGSGAPLGGIAPPDGLQYDHGAAAAGGNVDITAIDGDGLTLLVGGQRSGGTSPQVANEIAWRHHLVRKPVMVKRVFEGRYRHPHHKAVVLLNEEDI